MLGTIDLLEINNWLRALIVLAKPWPRNGDRGSSNLGHGIESRKGHVLIVLNFHLQRQRWSE